MADSDTLTDAQIAEIAARMRVSDPNVDNGAFSSLTRSEAVLWLKTIGASDLRSKSASDEDVFRRLRFALWDAQRIDNLFPGQTFASTEKNKLNPDKLRTWPDWKKPHPELRNDRVGTVQMDGFKDADRLDKYVMRHFTSSAFSQAEIMSGSMQNLSDHPSKSWMDTKNRMGCVSLDITRDGVLDYPWLTYHSEGRDGQAFGLLLIELLDVKQCPWPEPSHKFLSFLQQVQVVKFGTAENAPLVPMLRTPTFPLIVVRYSYMEGRPEGGSKFMERFRDLVHERFPNLTTSQVSQKFQRRLGSGERTGEAHLRMFARMLSCNADFLDTSFTEELQSHWNGISQDVKKETRISFIAPCLRLRWRALEEIETGIPPAIIGTTCHACGKPAEKLICNSCKSVHYCSKPCSVSDWPKHKFNCKLSKHLISNPSDTTVFPSGTFYVPAKTYVDTILDSGFAVEQEAVKYSGTTLNTEGLTNEYGDTRFIMHTQVPRNPQYPGQTVFMWDRRRSLMVRTGPSEGPAAKRLRLPFDIPFHEAGWKEYNSVLKAKGFNHPQVSYIYLFARRVGDCLELEIFRIRLIVGGGKFLCNDHATSIKDLYDDGHSFSIKIQKLNSAFGESLAAPLRR